MGIQMHIQTNPCNVRRSVFFRKMFQEPQLATQSVPEQSELGKGKVAVKTEAPFPGLGLLAQHLLNLALPLSLGWETDRLVLPGWLVNIWGRIEKWNFFSPSNCYLMKCRAVLFFFFFQSCFWLEWLTAGGDGRKLGWWGFGEELGGFYCLKK